MDALKPGEKPRARVEPWPRGGAKSSTGELGIAYVGCKLSRKFVLYVSETQDQADRHVQSVASLFERVGMDRSVSKYGHSKGWRRDQLRTANGFNVAALGLDTASRGIKLDEFRPDLIIFDDIDNLNDSPKVTAKKTETIRSSIIPAGSADCAILFLQNLIHEYSIVSSLVDGTADFLHSREVAKAEPAVVGLEVERELQADGSKLYRIVRGEATWEGQDIKTCEAQINEWGHQTFLRESQHEVAGANGLFFDVQQFRYCAPSDIPEGLKMCRAWDLAATQKGGDFTAGVLLGIAPNGVVYVLDLKREQYASNDVRSLIDRTSKADNACTIYGADQKHLSGAFASAGDVRFSFSAPSGSIRLRLPQDPGQAGVAQKDQFREAFTDALLKIQPVTGKKAVRARGWQEKVNRGNAILVRGDWNDAFVREHRLFREDEEHDSDDIVDASSDAFNEVARNGPVLEIY